MCRTTAAPWFSGPARRGASIRRRRDFPAAFARAPPTSKRSTAPQGATYCQPRAAEANFELCSGSAFCVQKSRLVGSSGVLSVNVPRPEMAPGEPGIPAGAACKPARHACGSARSQARCPTRTRCSAREPAGMMSCMALVMIMTRAMQLIMKGTFNRAALLGVRHWHALADDRRAC